LHRVHRTTFNGSLFENNIVSTIRTRIPTFQVTRHPATMLDSRCNSFRLVGQSQQAPSFTLQKKKKKKKLLEHSKPFRRHVFQHLCNSAKAQSTESANSRFFLTIASQTTYRRKTRCTPCTTILSSHSLLSEKQSIIRNLPT
jgi:hypothetical protein